MYEMKKSRRLICLAVLMMGFLLSGCGGNEKSKMNEYGSSMAYHGGVSHREPDKILLTELVKLSTIEA